MQNFLNTDVKNPSVCLSFDEALGQIKEQIEMESFPAEMLLQAQEIAGIIAQVFTLSPKDVMRVAGYARRIGDVQTVFRHLHNEHIVYVIEAFNQIPYRVRYKSAYFRSALFNAVFELESAENNDFAAGGEHSP